MAARPPEVAALWTAQYDDQDEMWLPIFFTPTAGARRQVDDSRAAQSSH